MSTNRIPILISGAVAQFTSGDGTTYTIAFDEKTNKLSLTSASGDKQEVTLPGTKDAIRYGCKYDPDTDELILLMNGEEIARLNITPTGGNGGGGSVPSSLTNQVNRNTSDLATLNGTGEGSVDKKIADAIAKLVANAPEDLNTLEEIADYIAADKTGAAQMLAQISVNTADIAALRTGLANAFDNLTPEQKASLKGDKGDTGDSGPQGPAGTFESLTVEQRASLKGDKGDPGDKGDKGDAFTYADFTPDQLAALTGPKGDTGEKGDSGSNGKSAYEIAQDNGFTGTEEEWLESLKGADGAGGGSSLQKTYIVGEVPFRNDWLSKTEDGEPLIPDTDAVYVIMTVGTYKGGLYMWDGTAYFSVGGSAQGGVSENRVKEMIDEAITTVIQEEY